MRYEKPEVVTVASAVNVIQGSMNKGPFSPSDDSTHATSTAYEADE